VIGEMSNQGEPWKKFVQTFFLAEQPNGYFVLNDIFRFLKEDVESDEGEPEQANAEPEHNPTSPQQSSVSQEEWNCLWPNCTRLSTFESHCLPTYGFMTRSPVGLLAFPDVD